MPNVPLINVVRAPSSRQDLHHFGVGLHPHEIIASNPTNTHHAGNHHRSWMNSLELMDFNDVDGDEKKSFISDKGYQVCLDVQHFAPNEITVKTVDRDVIVIAKHAERLDEHGSISREFTRRYELPEGFDPKDVHSSISSDGVLIIKAPPVGKPGENVRHIQIQHTGIPHPIKVTGNKVNVEKTADKGTN